MSDMTGDEYMELLAARQADWVERHPSRQPWIVPLLEWFIRPGDEDLFTPPPEVAQPKPVRQKRQLTPARVLRERREAVQKKLDAIVEADGGGDPAAVNIAPSSSKRHIARAGVRRFAKMDRDLAKVADLRRRISALDYQIARADAREAKVGR